MSFILQTLVPVPVAISLNALAAIHVSTATKEMIGMLVSIVCSILVGLIALVLGLLIRRLLVRRLSKTVLDGWVIQTLGLLVIIPPLFVGGIVALAIWNYLQPFFAALGNLSQHPLYDLIVNLIETLLLLSLGIGAARTINKLTIRNLGESRVDVNIRTLIGRIFYIISLIIVCFWVLSIWQIPLTNIVAAAGVLTVAITFAIQDILKDLVAGFYLLLERPFFIGDQVSVTIAPTVIYVGKVEDIRLRATKLRLVGGEEITIPNSILFGGPVTNNTYFSQRRATIVATLPEADFSRTETMPQIIQTLKGLTQIVEEKPEPTAMINSYTAEAKIILVVRFWLASGQLLDISDAMAALHTLLPTAELAAREPSGMI